MNYATSANPLPGEGRSETPVTALEIGMFLVLLASYALNAMDRQIFPLIAADVRREFGFGLADTGLLSTIFTLGMALAGVPTDTCWRAGRARPCCSSVSRCSRWPRC